jgi:hypothetical protein
MYFVLHIIIIIIPFFLVNVGLRLALNPHLVQLYSCGQNKVGQIDKFFSLVSFSLGDQLYSHDCEIKDMLNKSKI